MSGSLPSPNFLDINVGRAATGQTPTAANQFATKGYVDAAVAGITVTVGALASVDLSTLPTSDPGGGRAWLNNAFICVGTPV